MKFDARPTINCSPFLPSRHSTRSNDLTNGRTNERMKKEKESFFFLFFLFYFRRTQRTITLSRTLASSPMRGHAIIKKKSNGGNASSWIGRQKRVREKLRIGEISGSTTTATAPAQIRHAREVRASFVDERDD